jgi:hypothetical protein
MIGPSEDTMKSVLACLSVITATVCLAACDGLVIVIGTGPSPLSGTSTTAVIHVSGGVIPIGTPISGAVTRRGSDVQFQIVPPRTGTLVLGVNWDQNHGLLDVLFASNMLPRPTNGQPFSARLPVQAGQTYMVSIADGSGGVSTSDINVPFTVSATME